ncbi:hypothetical protein ACS0TY_005888 [Phlomoides rotata]
MNSVESGTGDRNTVQALDSQHWKMVMATHYYMYSFLVMLTEVIFRGAWFEGFRGEIRIHLILDLIKLKHVRHRCKKNLNNLVLSLVPKFTKLHVNEYSSLKEESLYSWADLGPGSFFIHLGGLWLITFTVLGVPIAAASFNLSKNKELYNRAFAYEGDRMRFLRWRIQFLERSIRKLDFGAGGINTIFQVCDLKNSPEFRITTKQALQILQDNYPEFVAKQVVYYC